MSARSGVVEETVAKPVAPKISAMVSPTPSSAVSSGMPAARSEPRVSQSTIRATSTPTPSDALTPGVLPPYASPPTDTCDPGRAACSSAPCCWSSSRVAGAMSTCGTVKETVMIAALRSSAT